MILIYTLQKHRTCCTHVPDEAGPLPWCSMSTASPELRVQSLFLTQECKVCVDVHLIKSHEFLFFLRFKKKKKRPQTRIFCRNGEMYNVFMSGKERFAWTQKKKTPHMQLQHIIQSTEEKSDRCNLGDYHASLCCECTQSCIHGRENVMAAWKPFITAVRTYTDAQLLEKKHRPAPLENHFNERMFFERKTVGGCDSRGHIFSLLMQEI